MRKKKSKRFKRIKRALAIILTALLVCYGGYRLYNYAIENAIARIRAGVEVGIRQNILSAINPINWFKGIFGHKKKKDDGEAGD